MLPGFSFNASDSLGLGAIFDNFVTTKDETQQNNNNLQLGQYGINAQLQMSQSQLEANKERNKIIMYIGLAIVAVFGLAVLLRS